MIDRISERVKNLFLKSRKVQRFFDRRFKAAEKKLAVRNRAHHRPGVRPTVDWVDVPRLSNFRSFFTFHDHHCLDVTQIPTLTWWRSHFRGSYRLHTESDATLAYACTDIPEGCRITSTTEPGTWIYLVSREVLPTTYALEFDYTPHTVFKEQLQLDFAATSLAERHRFILTYNERLRYQRVVRGFLLDDVAVTPCTVPLNTPSRIRLEIAERTFTFLVNGVVVACWEDCGYQPHPARAFMLFWNGMDAQKMDVEVTRFRVQVPKGGLSA